MYEDQQGGQWVGRERARGRVVGEVRQVIGTCMPLIARILLNDLENQLQELSREVT